MRKGLDSRMGMGCSGPVGLWGHQPELISSSSEDLWGAEGRCVLLGVWNSLWRNLLTSMVLPWTWAGPCYKLGSQDLWKQNGTFDCNSPWPTKVHYPETNDDRQAGPAWSPLPWLCWDWTAPGGKCDVAVCVGLHIHPLWKMAEYFINLFITRTHFYCLIVVTDVNRAKQRCRLPKSIYMWLWDM